MEKAHTVLPGFLPFSCLENPNFMPFMYSILESLNIPNFPVFDALGPQFKEQAFYPSSITASDA